ncbi:hypothetical protein TEU_03310 [Thermococcus eurythermalis]|uniref:Uncharacterized protein n=1 Tax=Thermococcus eurythermalis TaxID=1505907 RepID=A0A097QSL2_9EURY|nr:hypothetical protein [Thermococcus eurythermalis]AIU69452.1 hypothetical protein TEU_03310 [Thermococcus eurythermalis]
MDRAMKFVIAIIVAGFLLILAVKYNFMNEHSTITYERIEYDEDLQQVVSNQTTITMQEAEQEYPLVRLINIILLFALIGLPGYLITRNDIKGAVMGLIGYLVVLITEPMWLGQFISMWVLGGLYQIVALIFLSAIIGGIGTVVTFREKLQTV